MKTIGQHAYDSYAAHHAKVNNTGVDRWHELEPEEQAAWQAGAEAVAEEVAEAHK